MLEWQSFRLSYFSILETAFRSCFKPGLEHIDPTDVSLTSLIITFRDIILQSDSLRIHSFFYKHKAYKLRCLKKYILSIFSSLRMF